MFHSSPCIVPKWSLVHMGYQALGSTATPTPRKPLPGPNAKNRPARKGVLEYCAGGPVMITGADIV